MSTRFWNYLDRLLAGHELVVDRPKGSQHPRYPDSTYPLHYGYLAGTTSDDGGGVDVWRGSLPDQLVSAAIQCVDLEKRDVEIKLLIGCTRDEIRSIAALHDRGSQAAHLIERPASPGPGVHIETVETRQPIVGLPTSRTAFVGRTPVGKHDEPGWVSSLGEYEAAYGPAAASALGVAVGLYFDNGGREAVICSLPGEGQPSKPSHREGLEQLERVDRFDLLCLCADEDGEDVPPENWELAAAFARQRKAILLVDPPQGWSEPQAIGLADLVRLVPDESDRGNAAIYYPHIVVRDPAGPGPARAVPPSGAVAGVYARTDGQGGVWKPPAGLEATLRGIDGLSLELGDAENGLLNPLGINCLRSFHDRGTVVWGARTMSGQDGAPAEWKYVPVRRLMLYIEASIERGTQWAVFEPNDELLWTAVRMDVEAFLHGLFQAGAFAGRTSDESYFVRCDATTMTQIDIENGRVNIEIGVAPLKPAEFVIIRIAHSRAADDS